MIAHLENPGQALAEHHKTGLRPECVADNNDMRCTKGSQDVALHTPQKTWTYGHREKGNVLEKWQLLQRESTSQLFSPMKKFSRWRLTTSLVSLVHMVRHPRWLMQPARDFSKARHLALVMVWAEISTIGHISHVFVPKGAVTNTEV